MNTEKTAAIYFNKGNQLLEEGNLDEAIASLRQAIELSPDWYLSHQKLGEALARQGKLEEAVTAYRKAIELKPDFSWSYHHLGDALEQQQQWEESVAAFRQAIELNPDHFGSYVGLGKSLEKLGELDDAIVSYRRAIELYPEADWIQYRLGDVLQQRTQVDLEGAIQSYRRAIELNPDDVQAHYRLGDLLIKQGDLEGAIKCWRSLRERNYKFSSECFLNNLELINTIPIKLENLVVTQATVGEIIQGSSGSQLLCQSGKQGLVSYGPYLNIPDGLYRVRIDCEFPELTTGDKSSEKVGFKFDIVSDTGPCSWYANEVNIKQEKIEFFIELVAAELMEIRFFATETAFCINSIEFNLVYKPTPSYYWDIGIFLQAKGQIKKAVTAYNKSIFDLDDNQICPDKDIYLDVYQKLLEIQPENFEVHLGIGKVLERQNDLAGAISSYRRAIEGNFEIGEAYQQLGELFAKQGELEEAIKCWRSLSQRNYHFSSHAFLNDLEPINTILIKPEQLVVDPATVGEIIQGSSGSQLLCQSGKQGLVSYGPYLNIPDGLYRVRIDCEFPELTAGDKSSEKVGFKFDIVSDTGPCSWYANEVNLKQEKIEFFIELVAAELIEIRFFATETAFCINSIEFNLVYKPTPSYYWDIGRFLQAKGKIKKAVNAYQKSHFNLSNNYNFHSTLAEYLIKQGYSEEASAVYSQWGEKSIQQGKLVEAITAYNSLLQIKPDRQEILEKVAELQDELEQISTDIEEIKKYIESHPNCPETWFKLGELYEKISDDLAIQSYQKTLDLDMDKCWPEAYVRIKKIRRMMGNFQRDVSREPVADSDLALSIVVQTYNRATRLQKSLESYIKTDRSDIEIIICDNNSTDNTGEVIQSFMAVDKRIRYIKNYTNLGASRNGFIGFVSAKAPLVMFITDDDYMTEGFVDAVIFIFDHFPTVGAVLNSSQSPDRLAAYSKNFRGGELYKKGKETVLSAALLSGQLCGSTYRRETVDYRLWNVNDSTIAAVWLSSDLAMRQDIYILFLKTEYTTINAYVNILTKDGQKGASSMLYRTKNGFLNWDVGAAEMVDFPLYLIHRLGLSSTEKWQFYHGRVAGLFQGWLWAHFRLWYPEDIEGAFIFLSRVLRHPYIRFSMVFWQIMIRESLSPSVNVTVQDRVTIIMLGCFMLIWRLIIYLRDLIDPGLADIYYTGAWPRKDTIQLKHSQAELEIEISRDIGYSALTVVHDLQYELDNM